MLVHLGCFPLANKLACLVISIEFVFQEWPCYKKQFTLSLADPLGRLRMELVRVVECLVF